MEREGEVRMSRITSMVQQGKKEAVAQVNDNDSRTAAQAVIQPWKKGYAMQKRKGARQQ